MPSSVPQIAAVVYGAGEGAVADVILARAAGELRQSGLRLAGAVQHNTNVGNRCRCDMTLEDLTTGHLVEISEYRGPEARGCRLDPAALEDVVGRVCVAIEQGTDLLIVNKFGKREIEGRGFRQPIEQALECGVPVLAAVNEDHLAGWKSFSSGFDCRLPLNTTKIVLWGMCRIHPATKSCAADR